MTYVVSVLNMIQIVYLVNQGLRILMMNHILPINFKKSNLNECVYLILMMKEKEGDVIEVYTGIWELMHTLIKQIKISLLQFNQRMHVNMNLQIIYGYHFLTNNSLTL